MQTIRHCITGQLRALGVLATAAWIWAASAAQAGNWGGTLATNAVMRAADNPHQLTASLTLSAGATLTIEPGVVLTACVGPSQYSVTVNGRILALGTAEQPIRIQGLDATRTGGSLTFNSAAASQFRYCHFVYLSYLLMHSSNPLTRHEFDYCVFRGFTGFSSTYRGVIYCSSGALCSVRHSLFTGGTAGIYALYVNQPTDYHDESDAPMFWYNTMAMNGLVVQEASSDHNFNGVDFFRYNRVTGTYGVHLVNGSSSVYWFRNLVVRDCDLSRCFSSLHVNLAVNVKLDGLTVANCDLAGLDAARTDRVLNPVLSGNYWGTTNAAAIGPKLLGGELDVAVATPWLAASPFPQADLDGSDGGNATAAADAELLKRYLVGQATLDAGQQALADVDHDGDIDIRDVLLLESFVNGLLWKLP